MVVPVFSYEFSLKIQSDDYYPVTKVQYNIKSTKDKNHNRKTFTPKKAKLHKFNDPYRLGTVIVLRRYEFGGLRPRRRATNMFVLRNRSLGFIVLVLYLIIDMKAIIVFI